jgi:hypothetical protein
VVVVTSRAPQVSAKVHLKSGSNIRVLDGPWLKWRQHNARKGTEGSDDQARRAIQLQ